MKIRVLLVSVLFVIALSACKNEAGSIVVQTTTFPQMEAVALKYGLDLSKTDGIIVDYSGDGSDIIRDFKACGYQQYYAESYGYGPATGKLLIGYSYIDGTGGGCFYWVVGGSGIENIIWPIGRW
jgi:hypothetical protein